MIVVAQSVTNIFFIVDGCGVFLSKWNSRVVGPELAMSETVGTNHAPHRKPNKENIDVSIMVHGVQRP